MAGEKPEGVRPRRAAASDLGADAASDLGADAASDLGADEDPGADAEPVPRRERARLALLVAVVAAVVVVGLAVGYSLINPGDDRAGTPPPVPSAAPSTDAAGPSPVEPDVLLSDSALLSPAQAKPVAGGRTWKVALTQRGLDEDSAAPACLGSSAQGQPPAQQSMLRLLSSSGQQPPGILHRAEAYATAAEATQAYALAATAVGGCAMTGGYLDSGRVITGLGDQATGVVVGVAQGPRSQWRTLVLSRTGRVVNVVDVAPAGGGGGGKALAVTGVARALAAVTNVQCKAAAGRCAGSVSVTDGPPPPGGDQPGFLAAGDLPPVGRPDAVWAGTVPAPPDADFPGSGCERVDWGKEAAQRRSARTYLLQDDSPTFGLDTIVLTERSGAAARKLVDRVKRDLDSCAQRKLTAAVTKPRAVSGRGARSTAVAGWTATVSQQTTGGTARYRVGIVSAGPTVVFTFLNPQAKLDLRDQQWDTVAVRAGQRASQLG